MRIRAIVPLLLVPAAASAQAPACPAGPADDQAIEITTRIAQPVSRLAPLVDSALVRLGYRTPSTPLAGGRVTAAPRFDWPAESVQEGWGKGRHPGVEVSVLTRAGADSTEVTISARALCSLDDPAEGGGPAATDEMVEVFSAVMLSHAIMERAGMVPPRPVLPDSARPEPRGTSLSVPDSIGGFAFESRHDYPDPRFGTQVRYTARDGIYLDVFLYPGPPADESCGPDCAQQAVDAEARGFVDGIPEMIRRYDYAELRLKSDERVTPKSSSRWRGGRHLVLAGAREGRELVSHFYLFAFPGYFLKVRASVPPQPGVDARIQSFVDAALQAFGPD